MRGTRDAITEGFARGARAHFAPRITYAIAPPSRASSAEKRKAIAAAQAARIAALPIEALLVYDVQDEAVRNGGPRPFAFAPKVDPLTYALEELEVGGLPLVVYRAVASDSEVSLRKFLERLRGRRAIPVFVGAPSREVVATLSLAEAYSVCRGHSAELPFGGIVIPERHVRAGSEDSRVLSKASQGCGFFVSQTLWSADATKGFLRDLAKRAELEVVAPPHILFTLSPCGSLQTLEFLEWLGVEVPRAIKNDLRTASDMLERSIELAFETYAEVRSYAAGVGIEVGCNVESVSSRAVEVEASIELLRRIERLESGPKNAVAHLRTEGRALEA